MPYLTETEYQNKVDKLLKQDARIAALEARNIALERVTKISAQIYRVTSLAFARTKQVECPHGNIPSFPTHAWWCDECWFEMRDALNELQEVTG